MAARMKSEQKVVEDALLGPDASETCILLTKLLFKKKSGCNYDDIEKELKEDSMSIWYAIDRMKNDKPMLEEIPEYPQNKIVNGRKVVVDYKFKIKEKCMPFIVKTLQKRQNLFLVEN